MHWFRRGRPSAEDAFASEIVALIHEIHGLKASPADGFALRIELPDGPVIMNLRTWYTHAQRLAGPARARQLRRAVLGGVPQPRPATWPEAAPRLLPAVRPSSWVNGLSAQMGDAGPDAGPFTRPLVPFLSVLCAIDSAHSIEFATAADLATWGVTDDAALRTATANLENMSCEVVGKGSATLIVGPDGYASSWLAVPAALARIAARIGDSVAVMAVDRDQLVLFDTRDHDAAAVLLESCQEHYQTAPRPLSPAPYLVRDTGIEPWEPPPGHPARATARKASLYLAVTEYHQQAAMLSGRPENAGGVTVASLAVAKLGDGSARSYAAWGKDQASGLIPRADMIAFQDGHPGSTFTVRFGDVLRLAGDALTEEPGYDPPRWRHHGWPDGATLEALRAHAAPLGSSH